MLLRTNIRESHLYSTNTVVVIYLQQNYALAKSSKKDSPMKLPQVDACVVEQEPSYLLMQP